MSDLVSMNTSASPITAAPDLSSLYYRVVRSDRATTLHDGSGALAFYNSACSNLLGYDSGELALLGSSAVLHPADTEALADATARAYAALDGSADARLRLVHKDGGAVEVDLELSRVQVGDRRYLLVESTPVAPAA
ncbi:MULTISPECIES: PAS domain-containing protein [unclassified Rhodococcus (in: high G+C Gram-positive bacteria)]|uniref:PAS domain-containing protein n=1 Tax=unclassified Rhodococcus (in: high G+C Gram-positive bacteria) TaxID=192944 RepID=UPI0012E3A882|nr:MULTISPECIES: PAS domain-containing protein [unclassified Rhodococcus (in: high G+C Gram-positive bacteria)]